MGQPQQTSPSFQQQMTLPNQTAAALASAQPQSQERRVDRASREIGQYLLRGWTLTDEPCPSASCGVPLMRSRDRQWLCVLCGSVPDPSAPPSSQQSTRLHSVTTSTSILPADHISQRPQSTIDDLDAELMQDIERQRTLIRERERVERERDQPVMNSSEHPSSTPTVSEAPTSSDQERRRQSDRASSLIGQKL
ncbi:hypothetical protein BKA69DRAFT_1066765 [Paraphysoderma sedebokerense]|nr:hypothetical protein BKA69DRAFT_1066765 [Paraphysoderma sedebokerense]